MTRVLLSSEDYQDTQFHEDAWVASKQYFGEFVQSLVSAHEKRYNSSTSYIALAGTVSLWKGGLTGGRVLNFDQNPLDCMGEVDEIDVIVEDDGTLTIRGYHHDGVHHMHLYIITDSAIEKLERKDLWDTPDGYAHIVATRKPVKLPRMNKFY